MRKETFKLLINKIVQFHNATILLFLTACCLLSSAYSFATEPPYLKDTSAIWVDSVLKSMTLDEKIGQLFMVAAYSNKDEASYKTIDKYINEYKVGGLIFFQGTPQKQAELTNRYQAQSKTPLWIGFDGEWGLGMRLDNTISYPRQLTLGAIDNTGLIYDMGKEIARQMKRIGIHINFAPDIDVNSNPNNPVINDRAFGDNKFGVVRRGLAYMQGMQDNKILASGKHFPGHGDTDVDSHKDLPVLNHTLERLESVELYPFKQFIRYGVGSIMVSHLNVLALDGAPNFPATLSPKIIQQKLIDSMHYNGLIFTDAMNMKGITKFYPSGVAEVMAIMAGNDVMLFPDDVDKAIDGVRCAVARSGLYFIAQVNSPAKPLAQLDGIAIGVADFGACIVWSHEWSPSCGYTMLAQRRQGHIHVVHFEGETLPTQVQLCTACSDFLGFGITHHLHRCATQFEINQIKRTQRRIGNALAFPFVKAECARVKADSAFWHGGQ